MPKRPKTHQIAEKAAAIFERILPQSWIKRVQSPDYGIDYVVEIVKEETLTGLKFAVQLKGSANPRKAGSSVCFPMETEHLAYYVDKERQPVFLVLIDVSNETGYWIFLQEHMLYGLDPRNWRHQKTVTIRTPEKQLLSDIDAFHKAIQKAEDFMVGFRPTAINTAIAVDIAHKQSLDPRFSVRITAEKDRTHYHLAPKEPINFNLTFKGEKSQIRERVFHLMIGRGVPVKFSADEINASGSLLIADIMKKGGTLHLQRSANGTVVFTAIHGKQQAMGQSVAISGAFEGGITEIRFSGCLPQSPFGVKCTFNRRRDGKTTSLGIRYDFDISNWCGQPISQLAYFDQILFLIKRLSKGEPLKVVFQIKGNAVFSGILGSGYPGDSGNPIYPLEMLSKAREIAKVIQLNPKLPQAIHAEQFQEIENLHRILIRSTQRDANGAVLCMGLDSQGVKRILDMDKATLENSDLAISGSSPQFNFIGLTVAISLINLKMTHARLLTKVSDLRHKLQQNDSESIEVKWVGTPKTQIVYDVNDIKVI